MCGVTVLCLVYLLSNDPDDLQLIVCKVLIIYTALIGVTLISFFLYDVCCLNLNNIASNENIRSRWNGHPSNQSAVSIYQDRASCWQRLMFFWDGKLSHKSRLH